MTERRVLTDEMWERLEPLLPDRTPRRGGQWTDHREVVEAIIWRFRTGSPWRDLPAGFPPWQTVWWRFDRWAKDGTFDRVLAQLQGFAHAARSGGHRRITRFGGLNRPTMPSGALAAGGRPSRELPSTPS